MRNRPARAVVSVWRPGPDEQPMGIIMYLERIEILPQGTPVFRVESGYKDCKTPSIYRAYQFAEKMICPGCARSCQLPASVCGRGDPFVVSKRSVGE